MSTSARSTAPPTLWTIGHSTRPLEEFLDLLAAFSIEAIADVRSFPASRKFPQYGKEALAATLAQHATGYHLLPTLGGRRRTFPGSPNTAWRNTSFRGYADHMASSEFAQGLPQLIRASSAHGSDVRRSSLVPLPSLHDSRRVVRAGHRGCAHPRCQAKCRTSNDIAREDRPRRIELCLRRARLGPGGARKRNSPQAKPRQNLCAIRNPAVSLHRQTLVRSPFWMPPNG